MPWNHPLITPLMCVCLIVLSMVMGCTEDVADSEDGEEIVMFTPRTCFPPEGLPGVPEDIEGLVTHLNTLPKPVTIPCFLESLERPLQLYATWNFFSAQPAVSPLNPRIFILNDAFAFAVVTSGDSRPLLEFSYRTSEVESIKGELEFPVETELTFADAYNRIGDADGSHCGFCHFNMRRVDSIDYAYAYASEFIPGLSSKRVDIDYLQRTYESCDRDAEPDRCWMFDSIFAHGGVLDGELE